MGFRLATAVTRPFHFPRIEDCWRRVSGNSIAETTLETLGSFSPIRITRCSQYPYLCNTGWGDVTTNPTLPACEPRHVTERRGRPMARPVSARRHMVDGPPMRYRTLRTEIPRPCRDIEPATPLAGLTYRVRTGVRPRGGIVPPSDARNDTPAFSGCLPVRSRTCGWGNLGVDLDGPAVGNAPPSARDLLECQLQFAVLVQESIAACSFSLSIASTYWSTEGRLGKQRRPTGRPVAGTDNA